MDAFNPAYLVFPGRVPALKNRKKPVTNPVTGQIIPMTNPRVKAWMNSVGYLVERQWQEQKLKYNWKRVDLPNRVCIVFQWFIYSSRPGVVPLADMDNAYTTVQEMLQSPDQPGGQVDIYYDDRQITWSMQEQYPVHTRIQECGRVYIWQYSGVHSYKEEYDTFHRGLTFREGLKQKEEEGIDDLIAQFNQTQSDQFSDREGEDREGSSGLEMGVATPSLL